MGEVWRQRPKHARFQCKRSATHCPVLDPSKFHSVVCNERGSEGKCEQTASDTGPQYGGVLAQPSPETSESAYP